MYAVGETWMPSVEARFAGRMIGGAKRLTNGKCGKEWWSGKAKGDVGVEVHGVEEVDLVDGVEVKRR
jgi:hypothetical protein